MKKINATSRKQMKEHIENTEKTRLNA